MLSLFLIILPCRADFGAREGMPLALQDEATTPVDGPTRAGGCDWPNPMYPPYKRKPRASVGRGLQTLRQLFEKHRATAFSYIDSGVALGMYRDGALIPGDSDIDVRWGASSPLKLPKKKTLDPLFSMNNFGKWGDKWTRRVLHPTKLSKADVAKVWGDLCLLSIVDAQGYCVHKAVMQRRAVERTYGAAWFVRMPRSRAWHPYMSSTKSLIGGLGRSLLCFASMRTRMGLSRFLNSTHGLNRKVSASRNTTGRLVRAIDAGPRLH